MTGPQTCRLERIKKRACFLRAAKAGAKVVRKGLVLQVIQTPDKNKSGDDAVIRAGFTTSKRIGNAVKRNHARRRLREAARIILPEQGQPGFDYVLIGRATTSARPFSLLLDDLGAAVAKATRIHKKNR